jgi:hypothetical protein
MERPKIAITMGDAAGIGPEIIMKALAHGQVYERCRPLVTGADRGRGIGSPEPFAWRDCASVLPRRHGRLRGLASDSV